jgi:hypothetical protein
MLPQAPIDTSQMPSQDIGITPKITAPEPVKSGINPMLILAAILGGALILSTSKGKS